jgi:hypothetical protein
MGLTRPRFHQLRETDFKNSCRGVTIADVDLSAAPATVDGVNLQYGDRVLVTGQTTASQNGIYFVSTLGSGSNGIWTRARDADEDSEMTAGVTLVVTEGTVYEDTQWKLTTPDPITIGTTALTWTSDDISTVTLTGAQTLTNKTLTLPVANKIVANPTATSVGTSSVVINSFSAAAYRGSKYIITVANNTDFDIIEALLVHNGTTATVTVYGETSTNASLGDVSADIDSGNVRLLYTGASAGNSVKVAATYISA